jgi:hypothetical protein
VRFPGWRVPLVAVALAAVLPIAAPSALATAQEGGVEAELAQIRELVLYARYPEAIEAAERLLAREGLRARQRNAALEVLATAQIADRRADAARATLELLYARDPEHPLSDADASPPVVSAFARARESRPRRVALELRHDPPRTITHRGSPRLDARVVGAADAVDELRLFYRAPGESAFAQVVMSPREGGVWSGRIPVVADAERAMEVDYYFVALAPSGAELARVGSEREPLRLRVLSEDGGAGAAAIPASRRAGGSAEGGGHGGSIAEEPAFWIVLALVVAAGIGAGVGIGVATAPSGPEQGTLGVLVLMH